MKVFEAAIGEVWSYRNIQFARQSKGKTVQAHMREYRRQDDPAEIVVFAFPMTLMNHVGPGMAQPVQKMVVLEGAKDLDEAVKMMSEGAIEKVQEEWTSTQRNKILPAR